MAKVEVVYFTGCPLLERARRALRDAGVSSFQEVNQDKLPAGHDYLRLSSPSILLDGRLVAGNRTDKGCCGILDWDALPGVLRTTVKI